MRAPSREVGGDLALARLGLVAGILLLVRLWLDGHLDLTFDEAYYALWAQHLAWSYFDHPPMVALWIKLSTICFGEHEFGVRALGTLSAAAGTGVVYLLSWHLFEERQAAIFAALLYCAMLLISAGAIIITPDTPLLFFWSIALYALVRIFGGGRARLVVGGRHRDGPGAAVEVYGPASWRWDRLCNGRRSKTAPLVAAPDAVHCGRPIASDLRSCRPLELSARMGLVRVAVRPRTGRGAKPSIHF